MVKTVVAAAITVVLAGFADATAQDWPTRPVTLVVPFPAGGGVDTGGRIVAPVLSELLSQQVVVENVSAGAAGMIGAARVAKAAPDGYQMLLGHSGTHSYIPTLYKRPMYDAVTDFEPVSLVYGTSQVLLTRKDFPANTLSEFIAYVKAHQSDLQYASGGAGSVTHITCVLLSAVVGLNVTHVPYRGIGPAMQDLIGGQIDFMCNPISTAMPQVEGGAVKAIALLSPHRYPLFPNLATADEQGLKNFNADSWAGFFFPRGTPAAIVQRLAKATSDALDTPAVRQRYLELGLRVPPPEQRTPAYLAKLVPAEIKKWAGPIKASGMSVD
jgi:tripartite-type tricarboxylate transporter receptor subunit TctC